MWDPRVSDNMGTSSCARRQPDRGRARDGDFLAKLANATRTICSRHCAWRASVRCWWRGHEPPDVDNRQRGATSRSWRATALSFSPGKRDQACGETAWAHARSAANPR